MKPDTVEFKIQRASMLTKSALGRTNLSSVTLCVCVCVCMCVCVCVVVGSSYFVIYVVLHNVVQQTDFTTMLEHQSYRKETGQKIWVNKFQLKLTD